MWLAADGSRVKEDFCTLQRHAARALREPLVPADADADFRVTCLPYLEAGVAWVEVVLFVVAGAVRDVALAVDAQIGAVCVDDRNGVETRTPCQLEEADRQHDLQFFGDLLEMLDRNVGLQSSRQLQIIRVRLLAEVRGFEQFLNQDDLCALGGSFTHQLFSGLDVGFQIPGTGHLGSSDGNDTAHENISRGGCKGLITIADGR